MTRVLVVGGAGYIGSQCAKELAQAGYEPVTLDDLSTGREENVRWGPLIKGSLADPGALRRAFDVGPVAAVMHFAARSIVPESVRDPSLYYRNNVAGTLALLDAMREHKTEVFVFSSTCAVYGLPERVPIPEDHPLRPITPYGASKMMVERALEDYGRAYGLKHASLRYFNAAGADPDGETGERHDPETHLIPLVLDAAFGRRPGVKVYGADYDTPDGTCIRDYIHTADLASAHILAMKRLMDGGDSGVYNLGNGTGCSVREVIETVRKVTGKDFPVEEAPRRPGDPPRLVGSAEKAKRELGWGPRYGALETIVRTAADFSARA